MTENRPRVGVGVLIENEKGEVLLGQRKGSHAEGAWAFPGGSIDFGETIFECAIRETKEESGLDVSECELVSIFDEFDYIKENGNHYINIGVKAMYKGGEPQVMEPNKLERWGWFSVNNLPSPLYATVNTILDNYKNKQVYKEGESK